jgi:hypothetical protein
MKTLLSSILLVSIFACGQTTVKQESRKNSDQPSNDWKKFDQSSYSVKYPSTWELDISGQNGTSFALFSPLESNKDKFQENVNLLVQDLEGQNVDLDRYTEISEAGIKTMITNSALIESKRIKNGNDEYHKIIYSGDQGIFHLQFEQYYWVINEKAFVLTFTSEKAKFADYKTIGEEILNSFILKK